MDANDRSRIVAALDYWVITKIQQQTASVAAGKAQGGSRAAVTGGKHLAGVNRLILDELDALGLDDLTYKHDRGATVPGWYRSTKSWDLLVSSDGEPALAMEYKSMKGSEGKNLNNRSDEVIGAAQDLKRAQQRGLLPPGLKRGYVFIMEVTPAVTKAVRSFPSVGTVDPVFQTATYLDRMAIMCERLRDDGLYDMAWAVGVTTNPTGFMEPRASVNWDRFKADLAACFS